MLPELEKYVTLSRFKTLPQRTKPKKLAIKMANEISLAL